MFGVMVKAGLTIVMVRVSNTSCITNRPQILRDKHKSHFLLGQNFLRVWLLKWVAFFRELGLMLGLEQRINIL